MTTQEIQHQERRLWTVADVADYLRVSKSWVYKAVENNELPVRRLGALLRFERAAIEAFMAAPQGAASARVAHLPAPRKPLGRR